jgi:hypothetical protein
MPAFVVASLSCIWGCESYQDVKSCRLTRLGTSIEEMLSLNAFSRDPRALLMRLRSLSSRVCQFVKGPVPPGHKFPSLLTTGLSFSVDTENDTTI